MVTLRKRARTLETPSNPKQIINDKTHHSEREEISGYEQFRDQRIKENMQRMKKLGIIDLSLKLKSELLPTKRTPRSHSERRTPSRSPLPSFGPPRRSSRFQNTTPVSYVELPVPKKEKSSKHQEILLGEGPKPEIYTEEHEKLLGHCKTSWTLFVDGYGKDGRRIYDPIKGKTCHQCRLSEYILARIQFLSDIDSRSCRQKTLGLRTHCIECNMVKGQFCGDCLYMRYGENVLEANQNPNWVCPVCRGICNCSLCRVSKGWPPTGSLYRKISSLGFKSVAHYLVQTQCTQTNSEENPRTGNPVSVKRSLPFANMEALSQQKESLDSNDGHNGFSNSQSGVDRDDDEMKGEKEEEVEVHSGVALERTPKLTMMPDFVIEPSPDSIAGRLRQRRHRHDGGNGCSKPESVDSKDFDDDKLKGEKEQAQDYKQQLINNIVAASSPKHNMKPSLATKPSPDNIAGRLRPRRNAS
ncbi:hypothetical protein HHK36_008449 [Tetracentron sinense]|uniref:Zinc-finger domain-containing protein n=1 Tax=Tetracentron sinense TaxID=13715 RepID=A0A834ZGQ6_TETSI|nr:hypothetical protein HHK36_008449 [Tetracentron sinense]